MPPDSRERHDKAPRYSHGMAVESVADLIAVLEERTSQIRRLLESVASTQDARPINEHWSFREVAAHLEACQTECVLVRIRQIAANAKPQLSSTTTTAGTSATATSATR